MLETINNSVDLSKLSMVTSMILAGASVLAGSYGMYRHAEFNKVYNQALERYADTNGDNFVSTTEYDAFNRTLFLDKDVTFVHGRIPKYKDGTPVPLEVYTQWVREYNPVE